MVVALDKGNLVGLTKVFGLYLKVNRNQLKNFQGQK